MGLVSRIGIGAALCAACVWSQAALVNAQYQSLGGNQWQADFTVTNDGNPAEVNGLTIYFASNLFDNLDQAQAPDGWDPLILQPVASSPWAYDVYLIDPGKAIGLGDSLGGFSVRFTWTGTAGTPGALPFDVYHVTDDGGIELDGSGRTQQVPLPASLWLALGGLGLLTGRARRSRTAAGVMA